MNLHPRFYPANNDNPSYGLDSILKALVYAPESIGAVDYIVKRNGAKCTGIKQVMFVYDGNGPIPASTLRKVAIKTAIKELICYLRGYDNIAQFHSLGVKTWDKDATENISWLNNPNRKGEGDIGKCYGALARNLVGPNGESKNVIEEQITMLRNGDYNRRNIISFSDPFVRGALPACLYEHVFTVHDGYLNLSSAQRSNDGSLGGTWNAPQCHFLLNLMAKLTGYKVGWVLHNVHDIHIYSTQVEEIKQFINNEPYPSTARLIIGDKINTTTTLAELDAMDVDDIFTVEGYQSHDRYDITLTV